MELFDKHFICLPKKRKFFLVCIGVSYFLIALVAYMSGMINVVEALLIMMVGVFYTEIIKLKYRIESLETKKR